MNITEFRQKYPEYKDIPDQELADKFYNKYYSDMDRNDFMGKFIGSAKPIKSEPSMNPVQSALAGFGGGILMQGKGLQQKAAQLGQKMGIVSPETVERITQEGEGIRSDLNRLKSESGWATAGDVGSDIATGIAIPGGGAGKLGTRMLTGGLSGALQAGARFTGKNNSTTGNAVTGGVLGAMAPAVMSPIAKGYNAIAGKLTKPINVAGKVPTTLGEDIGSPALQRAETLLERVPLLGITGFRKEQHAAAEKAAKEYLGSFAATGIEGSRGLLEKNRKVVSDMYEGVKKTIGEGYSNLPLYATETNKAASELLDRFPDFFKNFQDVKTETILSNIRKESSYFAEKGKSAIQKNIPAKGAPIISSGQHDSFQELGRAIERQARKNKNIAEKYIEPTNHIYFNDMWELRKGIGDILGQAKQKMISGDVNKSQYSALSKMYSAISEDMDKFASSVGSPDISAALSAANNAYKQNVVKYNVIERAYDKAAGAIEDTGKTFSPQRFHSALDGILKKEKYNNLFTSTEKREMAGIANIMTTVKRAGQFMENPPTGNRMVDIAIGGGAVGSLLNPAAAQAAGTTAATAGILKFLTTTDTGKRLAMAASTIEPSSPSMRKIMEAVYKSARSGMTSRSFVEEKYMGDNNE